VFETGKTLSQRFAGRQSRLLSADDGEMQEVALQESI